MSKRLTLNIGLRYEFISMPMERRDAEASFNIATGALDIANGRTDPLPASFFPRFPSIGTPRGNWYRRIGTTSRRASDWHTS